MANNLVTIFITVASLLPVGQAARIKLAETVDRASRATGTSAKLKKVSEVSNASSGCALEEDDTLRLPEDFLRAGNAAKCNKCLAQSGCKWCPLTQVCVHSTWLSSESCPKRPDRSRSDAKLKVKNADECSEHESPWESELDSIYGEGWHESGKHDDAIRCVAWSLGWPIPDDPFMKKETKDNIGRWACTSALLREGFLAMLGRKQMATASQLQVGEAAQSEKDSLVEQKAAAEVEARSNLSDWPRSAETTWEPGLCSFINYKVGDEAKSRCYVRSFFLEDFKKLLDDSAQYKGVAATGISTSELVIQSIESGPLVSFKPGAGKSGSGFSRTWDNRFKVKLGLKYEFKMNEPDNLIKMVTLQGAPKGAPSLHDHLVEHPESLLNRMYGMMKIAQGSMRSYTLLLADAFYYMDSEVSIKKKAGADVEETRYDLKGESRDLNESYDEGFTLVNGDLKIRENNHLALTEQQCLTFRQATAADVNFLDKHGIIDYSFLVMTVKRPQGALTCDETPGEPFCTEHMNNLYTISILDYLNDLTWAKKAESWWLDGKFVNYGMKMLKFAEKICPTEKESRIFDSVHTKVLDEHGSMEKAFKAAGSSSDALDLNQLTKFCAGLGFTEEEVYFVLDRGKPHIENVGEASAAFNFQSFKFIFDI